MVDLRGLPSVDQLLQNSHARHLITLYGRPLVTEAARLAVEEKRQVLKEGKPSQADESELLMRMEGLLMAWLAPTLRPVINATGVILHTNLGRAPLSENAQRAVVAASTGYNTLEFDLKKGQRGSRTIHAEGLLSRLTGAEAALVVNNNAAAVLLCLSALAHRKRVVIARGQLVEIGGGFRIPDVMKQSGAKLVEIGTTNRVHVVDYEEALREPTGLVLRVHSSNFRVIGFTAMPELIDLVRIAHNHQVPLLDDLGSGALLDTARYGLAHEPTVQESLAAGADLICFSGDKLLGGPQAGIIVGRAELLAKIKKHPLARAVRADKLCLAALSATLEHYLKDEALTEIPIWQMIAQDLRVLRSRAEAWREKLGVGEVLPCQSTVGGGSLPEEMLAGWCLGLQVRHPNQFMRLLREQLPPVIARVEDERVIFDPRTVLPGQECDLLACIRQAYQQD